MIIGSLSIIKSNVKIVSQKEKDFIMKKIFTIAIAVLMMFAVPVMADVTINGSGSGFLTHSFANSTYTDNAQVGAAGFTMNTTYGASAISRNFEITATYNYSKTGMNGTAPVPGALDGGTFVTNETATGNWVSNELAYETVYPASYQPGAGKVTASSVVDFSAGTVNINNYVAAAGERSMTQQVGTSSYVNAVTSYTPGSNAGNKMELTATFGGTTNITGHGAYSPSNVTTNFQNNNGFAMDTGTTFFNNVDIDFTGNSYLFDFDGIKGAGWNFDISNN